MRTLACVVSVLYLGWAGTAVAEGGAGTGLSRSALWIYHHQHYHHHHRYVQHLERKIVARGLAKAGHHHLRPSGYAEELTPHNVSFEMLIPPMPINKTYTLASGTPLLGLDPRSPSTWLLFSEMLPFIFSEAPVAPGEVGM